jgi:hypothetical protein
MALECESDAQIQIMLMDEKKAYAKKSLSLSF